MGVCRAGRMVFVLMPSCGLNTFGSAEGPGATAAATTSDGSATLEPPTGSAPGTGSSSGAVDGSASSGAPDSSTGAPPPAAAPLQLGFSQVRRFDFTWPAVADADYYQLLERPAGDMDYGQIGADIVEAGVSLPMPLHRRLGASYTLRTCGAGGCTGSESVEVTSSMAAAVGYFKASNTDAGAYFGHDVAMSSDGTTLAVGAHGEADAAGVVYVFVSGADDIWTQQQRLTPANHEAGDYFGYALALSGDGTTLVVGAHQEDSAATGVDGDGGDNSVSNAGAVYVYDREANKWSQSAYIKASNPGVSDVFGYDVTVSTDGNTLAVGAAEEDSGATGIDGDDADNSAPGAGAVYVFARDANKEWSPQAYLKASNTGGTDYFGNAVQIAGSGDVLAVGAFGEDSGGDNDADDSAADAGAVYLFVRDGDDKWTQQAYLKAYNAGADDHFGQSLALSLDGSTVVVGAYREASGATGVGGNYADNSVPLSGAVYVFESQGDVWSQAAYVKASNTGASDTFGYAVALSGAGDVLAVGAASESSAATGVGGDQSDGQAVEAGAVYVFERDRSAKWSQRSYVKASNADKGDQFGFSVALAEDGNILAVGANQEDSAATGVGVGGNQANNSALDAGAVYLY